jgi:hypothetical protein
MNIAKTTLAWWSFFMLRNSCLILTYFIFASVSFAKVILNSIDNEQIAHLYAVCFSLKKYSSVEYITLKKGDSLIERHDIKQHIPLLHQRFVEDKELGNLVENFKNQNIFSILLTGLRMSQCRFLLASKREITLNFIDLE